MSRSAAAAAAAAALVGVLAAFTAAGCVPSNVVARSDRMVATAVDELEFGPADALRLDGFWVTERVTGAAPSSASPSGPSCQVPFRVWNSTPSPIWIIAAAV